MGDKNLKLYFFDRIPPASYVEILVGILITAVPMTIFMLNIDALRTGSHGSLSDFGILILIVASFLSLFGLIIMFAGSVNSGGYWALRYFCPTCGKEHYFHRYDSYLD